MTRPRPSTAPRRPPNRSHARGASGLRWVDMLRISWPLALLLAAVVAVVARRPRLVLPILVVFGIWFLVQAARGRRR